MATKPLDPQEDFDKPVRRQTTLVPEEARTESAVRKGFCLASFVKPIPERDKKDHPFLTLELSFPLTEEHEKEGVLPDEIREAWKAVEKHKLRNASALKVDAHDVKLRLVPDSEESELTIKAAAIEKAVVSIIQEKGTGKGRKVVRLQLRVKTSLDKESWRWAGQYFGRKIWLRMYQAQGNLLH